MTGYNIEIDEDEFYMNHGEDKNYNAFREWLEDEIKNIIEDYENQSEHKDINLFICSIYEE